MSILDGKNYMIQALQEGFKVSVFDEPPVSNTREPDEVYSKPWDGVWSDSQGELSEEDATALELVVNPPESVEEEAAPVVGDLAPEDAPAPDNGEDPSAPEEEPAPAPIPVPDGAVTSPPK